MTTKYPTNQIDLNALDWIEGVKQKDYSAASGKAQVYFKNLERALLQHINEAGSVIGCVAWLTLSSILEALARRSAVSLLVQKEDWLRLDTDANGRVIGRKTNLRAQIAKLPRTNARWFDLDNRLYFGDNWVPVGDGQDMIPAQVQIDPVRCVGPYSGAQNKVHPRMHHKFLVFCQAVEHQDYPGSKKRRLARPYAVWTGSFNITSNATRSFENAVVIRDEVIADAYMKEWAQLMAFSEPLDWSSEEPCGDMDFGGFWSS